MVRLSRCEVRDHINYRKNDRWRSHRFYRALQRLESPMRYICEIFGAPQFSSFSTLSATTRLMHRSNDEAMSSFRQDLRPTKPGWLSHRGVLGLSLEGEPQKDACRVE